MGGIGWLFTDHKIWALAHVIYIIFALLRKKKNYILGYEKFFVISDIDNDEYGIYHAVCKGSCNRYEFAQAILEYTGNTGKIKLIPIDKTDVLRPDYCVLDNMMLRLTGMEEPAEWKTALKEYLDETGGLE